MQVKSVLDPCEDENDDIQDDEVSLGADSMQRDDSSESDSEVKLMLWIQRTSTLELALTRLLVPTLIGMICFVTIARLTNHKRINI